MADYTNRLEESSNIDLLEVKIEDVMENLGDLFGNFRTFEEAIAYFAKNQGFSEASGESLESFIINSFKNNNVPLRNIKEWFKNHKPLKKKPTGFHFCFGFKLGIEEANDFFRRIFLEKGIDCHDLEEAVYYYCLKNNLDYVKAEEIISLIKDYTSCENEDDDIPYTDVIALELDRICDEHDLVNYLCKNKHAFKRKNMRATENVQTLWKRIASKGGVASQELFSGLYMDDESRYDPKKSNDDIKELSTWDVFKLILGFYSNQKEHEIKELEDSRSIRRILENNTMVCEKTADDFPDRQGIDAIIAGRSVGTEKIRKTLIMLTFYDYWASLAIKNKDYLAEVDDKERCIDKINHYLMDSGYHELYYGNPYDLIFLLSTRSDSPLAAFREYMFIALGNSTDTLAKPNSLSTMLSYYINQTE